MEAVMKKLYSFMSKVNKPDSAGGYINIVDRNTRREFELWVTPSKNPDGRNILLKVRKHVKGMHGQELVFTSLEKALNYGMTYLDNDKTEEGLREILDKAIKESPSEEVSKETLEKYAEIINEYLERF